MRRLGRMENVGSGWRGPWPYLALAVGFCLLALGHGQGGFLEDELPLTIEATTPRALLTGSRGKALSIDGKRTITVVFSRPVIALGANFGREDLPPDAMPFSFSEDVPGRFRWATTSIARFDPLDSWPSDLDVDFIWNINLTTFDGVRLQLGDSPDSVRLRTPGLKAKLVGVGSATASNLTDDHWDGLVGAENDMLPEIPEDGSLVLEFSDGVELVAIQDGLQTFELPDGDDRNRMKTGIKPTIRQCVTLEIDLEDEKGQPIIDKCAIVKLDRALKQGVRYLLVLPKGTRYKETSGPLRSEITFRMYGLRPFRIPFRVGAFQKFGAQSDVPSGSASGIVSSRRLIMWLPHGLSSTTSEADLHSVISIVKIPWDNPGATEEVQFNLTLTDKGTLACDAALQPAEQYRLSISSNISILDGFGLPLEGGDQEFVTSFPARFLDAPSMTINFFEASQGWDHVIPAVNMGDPPEWNVMRAWPINPSNTDELLKMAYQIFFPSTANTEDVFGPPSVEAFISNDATLKNTTLDISGVIEGSGMAFVQMPASEFSSSPTDAVYIESDLAVSLLRSQIEETPPATNIFVFVTSNINGLPISGARVVIMKERDDSVHNMEFLEEKQTDNDGVASFKFSQCTLECGVVIMVQYGKQTVMRKDNIYWTSSPRFEVTGKVVFDRKLVRPGEELKCGGFIARRNGEKVTAIGGANRFTLKYRDPGSDETRSIKLDVDPDFGTFEAAIPIPLNAKFDEFEVSLTDNKRQISPLETVYFTVGDPRPPTAELILVTPPFVRPNSSIEIEVQAVSFIGANVGGAIVDVTFSVNGEDFNETITTDATGLGNATFDLLDLEDVAIVGDRVVIRAVWIGPTRERLVQEQDLRIQLLEKSIEIFTSISIMDIPGIQFGVAAFVDSVLTGPVDGDMVEVLLIELYNGVPEGQVQNFEDFGTVVDECLVESGDVMSIDVCRLSLPGPGHFILQGCINDNGTAICSYLRLGKNLTEWEKSPLSDSPILRFISPGQRGELDNGVAEFGSNFVVYLDVPYSNGSALLFHGNKLKQERQMLRFRNPGVHQISIPVGEECIGSCHVEFIMSIPRQAGFSPEIPIAVEHDASEPRTISDSFLIDVTEQSRTLQVRTKVTKPDEDADFDSTEASKTMAIAPGENASIWVQITKCTGDPNNPSSFPCLTSETGGGAQVMVIAVDKAVLELVENPLANLTTSLESNLVPAVSRYLAPSVWPKDAFNNAVDIVFRRLALDPWLHSLFSFMGYSFNKPDELLLQENAESVSVPPPGISEAQRLLGRTMNQAQTPTGPSAATPQVTAASGPTPTLRQSEDFVTTPLFRTFTTEANGQGKVTFTAPQNIGTFAIRVYSASNEAQHGSTETEIIVRLPLSLTPSVPRLVRVGDEFEAGAIITVFGADGNPVPVSVVLLTDTSNEQSVQFLSSDEEVLPTDTQNRSEKRSCKEDDNACLIPISTKNVFTDEDGQIEVRFRFRAIQIGNANITIRADGGGSSDALQVAIPVMGQQEEVKVAMSFSIESGTQNRFVEGLNIPKAVSGSGTLDLRAGVGSLATIVDISRRILETRTTFPNPEWALANLTVMPILQTFGVDKDKTEAEFVELFSNATTAFNEALQNLELENLTDASFGLLPLPMTASFFTPSRVDIQLNAFAIWAVRRILQILQMEGSLKSIRIFEDGASQLSNLTTVWQVAMEQQVLQDAEQQNKDGSQLDLSTLAWIRLALGPDWSPPLCTSDKTPICTQPKIVKDLSLERLTSNFNKLSVESRACLALAQLEFGHKSKSDDVQQVVNSFIDSMRVIGRTAYISVDTESSQPADLRSQALAQLVFTESGIQNDVIKLHANYVSGGAGGSQSVFISEGPLTLVTKCFSITAFDQTTGSTDPDLELTVKSGNITLLKAQYDDPADPVMTTSTSFDELGSSPSPLMFRSQGSGQVQLVATLNFIPAKLLPFPTYRGIFVERIIQKLGSNDLASSEPLSVVPLSTQLLITLQITSPDELGAVTIRALMPGGIEPLDPSIAEGAETECSLGELGISFQFWLYPLCPSQETRPSKVTFRYSRLRAGTQTIAFKAIAATVGSWILPPIQAFANDQPEVMGLSSPGEFEICSGERCQERGIPTADSTLFPKSCPVNCNGLGICDLRNGECICDVGFTGDDCSIFEDVK